MARFYFAAIKRQLEGNPGWTRRKRRRERVKENRRKRYLKLAARHLDHEPLFGMLSPCSDPEGRPIGWGRYLYLKETRPSHVALTRLPTSEECWVSTVWGIPDPMQAMRDHFPEYESYVPRTFESMVFGGALHTKWSAKYPTRDEALRGHQRMVTLANIAQRAHENGDQELVERATEWLEDDTSDADITNELARLAHNRKKNSEPDQLEVHPVGSAEVAAPGEPESVCDSDERPH